MKFISLSIIFSFCFFTCFSQNPTDTLKELNDLKALKSQLLEKVSQLQKSYGELQTLIDSTKIKSDSIKTYIANEKPSANDKQSKTINKQEKFLKEANVELDKQSKRQVENKKKLQEALDLIKEIDVRINELSKKAT